MRGIRHIFLLSLVAATCAGAAEIRVRVIVPHTALHIRGDESSDVLGQASADQELLATGTIRRVLKNSTATTALYRITGDDRDGGLRTFCFIIGDNAQCEAYLNELVTIEGPAWWLVNESAPVIKMDRLVQEKP